MLQKVSFTDEEVTGVNNSCLPLKHSNHKKMRSVAGLQNREWTVHCVISAFTQLVRRSCGISKLLHTLF